MNTEHAITIIEQATLGIISRYSHNFSFKICEFLQVPSMSMGVHGTLRYLNLTFNNYCRTGFLR